MGSPTNWKKHNTYVSQYTEYRLKFKELIAKKMREKAMVKKASERELRYLKYLVIYVDFLEIMVNLSGGALSLYVLIGLSANPYGHSHADISKYCELLNCPDRLINKWIAELLEKRLIYFYKSTKEERFFICPYGSEEYVILENDDKSILRQKYMSWIRDRMKRSEGGEVIYKFFVLPHSFTKYMKALKPDSIKLYIYCGLSMDLSDGYLTQSLSQFSKRLGFSARKIGYCFDELIGKGLVFRQQLKYDQYSYTYLLPLKTYYEKKEMQQ